MEDPEGGEVFDVHPQLENPENNEVQQLAPLKVPHLLINRHRLPHEGFRILNPITNANTLVQIPYLRPNDKMLYSDGSWGLLLRRDHNQSVVLLNLQTHAIKRLPVFEANHDGRTYPHDIRSGTFRGQIDGGFAIYLIERFQDQQHSFVIWMSNFQMMLNDGDGMNPGNDNENDGFLEWHRHLIAIDLPALDVYSLVFCGGHLFWITHGGDVQRYNINTGVTTHFVRNPGVVFAIDPHPYGPRAFLVVEGNTILYVSVPMAFDVEEDEWLVFLEIGDLVLNENQNGSVQPTEPPMLYVQGGSIFVNRGQGGLYVPDSSILEGIMGGTIYSGPCPLECVMYDIAANTVNKLTYCRLDSCEALWFLSDDGDHMGAGQWNVVDIPMYADQFNPGLQEHVEAEQEEDVEDCDSSVETEEVTTIVQEGFVSERFMLFDGCKKMSLIKPPLNEGLDGMFTSLHSRINLSQFEAHVDWKLSTAALPELALVPSVRSHLPWFNIANPGGEGKPVFGNMATQQSIFVANSHLQGRDVDSYFDGYYVTLPDFLLNPTAGARIDLLSICYRCGRAVFCTTTEGAPKVVIFVISMGTTVRLYLVRPGGACWDEHHYDFSHAPSLFMHLMVLCNNYLHCFYKSHGLIFKLEDLSWHPVSPRSSHPDFLKCAALELEGKVVLVDNPEYITSDQLACHLIRFFRMEMSGDSCEWVDITGSDEELDGRIWFVDSLQSFSVKVASSGQKMCWFARGALNQEGSRYGNFVVHAGSAKNYPSDFSLLKNGSLLALGVHKIFLCCSEKLLPLSPCDSMLSMIHSPVTTHRNTGLYTIVFMVDILPEGTEVAYNVGGKISLSPFEAHAGQATWREMCSDIYTSDRVSYKMLSLGEIGDLCSICSDTEDLIVCYFCPRAFDKGQRWCQLAFCGSLEQMQGVSLCSCSEICSKRCILYIS